MTGTASLTPASPSVVILPAEIDQANASAVSDLLAAQFGTDAVVIADMAATTYCDSSGVRALLRACRDSRAGGCDLRLVLPDPSVLRILMVLGLDQVLPIYPSLTEALAGRSAQPVSEDSESVAGR
jgi:anti-sigma B factor antagonist